jgi:hypothetical protein
MAKEYLFHWHRSVKAGMKGNKRTGRRDFGIENQENRFEDIESGAGGMAAGTGRKPLRGQERGATRTLPHPGGRSVGGMRMGNT